MEPKQLDPSAWPFLQGVGSGLHDGWVANRLEPNDDAQQRAVTDPPSPAAAAREENPFKENIALDPVTGRPFVMANKFVSPTKRKSYSFNPAVTKYESLGSQNATAPPEQQRANPPKASFKSPSVRTHPGLQFTRIAPSVVANEALGGKDKDTDKGKVKDGDARDAPFATRVKPQVTSGNQK
jgi:hypothetical protein